MATKSPLNKHNNQGRLKNEETAHSYFLVKSQQVRKKRDRAVGRATIDILSFVADEHVKMSFIVGQVPILSGINATLLERPNP